MILSDSRLATLCENTDFCLPHNPDLVGPCSRDLLLAPEILYEAPLSSSYPWMPYDLNQGAYELQPGEFILASTQETIRMPRNLCGQLMLRSTAARMGLEHSFSGLVDPLFEGTLTLELRNNLRHHPITIEAGMRLLQLVVLEVAGTVARPYNKVGWYQNQNGPTASNNRVHSHLLVRRDFNY